jgi:hypothetical protein
LGAGSATTRQTARVEALRDALDGAALAGGVAALEQDHHLVPGVGDPLLQFDQLALQPEQLAEVADALGTALNGAAGRVVVLDLELHLLVEPVDDLLADAADELPVVTGSDHE